MWLKEYVNRMKGGAQSPTGVSFHVIFWSGLASFIGIAVVAYLSKNYFNPYDLTLLIGSFGASAVLVYGAIKTPLAQPRNLMGGHILSGIVGVASYKLLGHINMPLAAAVAVSFAIMLMHATKTLHPPGGATALIAVIGGKGIYKLGFLYALMPAGLGAF
ncbi:MAG: HPP family protein, partial [Deltaproteobacteria bacterium]|nr:HPP family protein [Deltaproteobacteria bacterium]